MARYAVVGWLCVRPHTRAERGAAGCNGRQWDMEAAPCLSLSSSMSSWYKRGRRHAQNPLQVRARGYSVQGRRCSGSCPDMEVGARDRAMRQSSSIGRLAIGVDVSIFTGVQEVSGISYTLQPWFVCLARDMGDTSQGHLTVDGGVEIETGGPGIGTGGL
ncbi:hypothetical protein B0T18DRAFT_164948 [Schizothecium vesticola]|uniref:Uncharacterized protein n=1 Tax=Schizothecium vesticola TaxID=314040 RepID=A0AA40EWY3_9PEZI|nr:hypothetical protein B0T18DRAFT_164948 [Schizothecium vesticola]